MCVFVWKGNVFIISHVPFFNHRITADALHIRANMMLTHMGPFHADPFHFMASIGYGDDTTFSLDWNKCFFANEKKKTDSNAIANSKCVHTNPCRTFPFFVIFMVFDHWWTYHVYQWCAWPDGHMPFFIHLLCYLIWFVLKWKRRIFIIKSCHSHHKLAFFKFKFSLGTTFYCGFIYIHSSQWLMPP